MTKKDIVLKIPTLNWLNENPLTLVTGIIFMNIASKYIFAEITPA